MTERILPTEKIVISCPPCDVGIVREVLYDIGIHDFINMPVEDWTIEAAPVHLNRLYADCFVDELPMVDCNLSEAGIDYGIVPFEEKFYDA